MNCSLANAMTIPDWFFVFKNENNIVKNYVRSGIWSRENYVNCVLVVLSGHGNIMLTTEDVGKGIVSLRFAGEMGQFSHLW